jgi:CheY-like chemotaxis protein
MSLGEKSWSRNWHRREKWQKRRCAQKAICWPEDFDLILMDVQMPESGMSAATPNYLNIGETVEVFPILGAWVKAIVRRKLRAMYGLEFLALTEEQTHGLRKLCAGLPLFQSMADI